MNKNKSYKKMYEEEGVYGDAMKFKSHTNRFDQIISFVKNLEEEPKDILDIGCGTGYLANEVKFIYPKAHVTGIDISKKALSIGKSDYRSVTFLEVDAEISLPFSSNHFDLIISGEHIEHLQDPDTYLSEIHRVMKKNGILILTTPNLGYWLSRLLLLFGRQPYYLEPSLRKTLPIISWGHTTFPRDLDTLPSGHLRLYTLDMLKKLLAAYNLKTIDVKGSSMLINFPLKQIDQFFTRFPDLSFGLVLKIRKDNI